MDILTLFRLGHLQYVVMLEFSAHLAPFNASCPIMFEFIGE